MPAIEILEHRALLSGASSLPAEMCLSAEDNLLLRAAITSAFPEAEIEPVEQESGGKPGDYTLIFRNGDQTTEVDIELGGEITEAATSIAPAELPASVANSLTARFPGAIIRKADATIEHGVSRYDVELEWGTGGVFDVAVNLVGEIESVEKTDDGELSPAVSVAAEAPGRSAGTAGSFSKLPPVVVFSGGGGKLGLSADTSDAAAVPPPDVSGVRLDSRGETPHQADSADASWQLSPLDSGREGPEAEAPRPGSILEFGGSIPHTANYGDSLKPLLAGLITEGLPFDVSAIDRAFSDFFNNFEDLSTAFAAKVQTESAIQVMMTTLGLTGLEIVRREAWNLPSAIRSRSTNRKLSGSRQCEWEPVSGTIP